jgi:uncharacterized protein YbaP (TraB family)
VELAGPPPVSPAPSPAARSQAKPLFWIADGGQGATLYLLGSIHLGPAEGWSYPEAIEKSFETSETLVVELDSRAASEEAQQQLALRHALLPAGQSLQQKVSAETYELLRQYVAGTKLMMPMLDSFRPWMVATLLVLEAAERQGLSPQAGVDAGFLERAGPKRVLPLETLEEQMQLFANLSQELQEMALRDALTQYGAVGDFLARMVEAWRIGDEKALTDAVFQSLEQYPEFAAFYEAVFFKRNHTMTSRLLPLLDKSQYAGRSVFVVIGVAHLLGQRGIPTLLADKGYRVRQLKRAGVGSD